MNRKAKTTDKSNKLLSSTHPVLDDSGGPSSLSCASGQEGREESLYPEDGTEAGDQGRPQPPRKPTHLQASISLFCPKWW